MMTPPCAARTAIAVLTLVVLAAATLDGRAPTARQRYDAAVQHDAAARAAVELVPPGSATAAIDRVVRAARRVVTEYEGVVRRFPSSPYCDNALMRGADLSQWLYSRYGRAADKVAAAKHYDWLAREYPASSLRRQALMAARALDAIVPAAEVPAARVAPPVAAPAAARTASPARAEPGPTAPVTPAPPPPQAATLVAIDRVMLDEVVRITLVLDRETPFSHDVINGPPRAFVDLHGATVSEPLRDASIRYDAGSVQQVRVGRRPEALRVVLDLEAATPVSVFTLYNPYRVIIDAQRPAAGATPAAAAAPPVPAVPVAVEAPPAVRLTDESTLDIAAGGSPAAGAADTAAFTEPPDPTPTPAPAPSRPAATTAAPSVPAAPRPSPATAPAVPSVPAANTDGKFSLSRQLGLGVSRVVIDPGHGGHDPGTLTSGTTEARVALDIALRLEKLLVKDGFEVVLTRRTDVFVPLDQRPAIANREGADLFLSIHANASRNPKSHGVEVYYLSFASNPEAEAVAARENATSAGAMHNLPGIVRAIALNNKLDESRELARMVQESLSSRLAASNAGLRNRGVKKAPFVVLIGAQMPSILAEVGFITNREEATLIKTPAYRQKIAESLRAAVVQYQRALKRQTAVATR